MPRRVGRHHARRHAAWRAFASVVVASGSMVVASQASTTSQAPSNITRGCVGAYEPSKDYFPDKVTVEDAVNFSVTYHRSYKVVSVRDDSRSEHGRAVCARPVRRAAADARWAISPGRKS